MQTDSLHRSFLTMESAADAGVSATLFWHLKRTEYADYHACHFKE